MLCKKINTILILSYFPSKLCSKLFYAIQNTGKRIVRHLIIEEIDNRVPVILIMVFSIWPLVAIFQEGVPKILDPALKVIKFDSEYRKTNN